MTTAADLIKGSLRLLGVLAGGETPSAEDAQDSLTTLNDMLDSWSTESLTVFSSTKQSVDWPIGQAEATLGPTGTLGALKRPIAISDNTYFTSKGMDYPLTIVSEPDYDSIVHKTSTSSFPQFLYVDPGFPNVTVRLFPVPNTPVRIHFGSVLPFARLDTLTEELELPPGYARAIRYNLAVELFPEFGVTPELNSNVLRTALISKRNLQRINATEQVLDLPAGFPCAGGRFNIYTGM